MRTGGGSKIATVGQGSFYIHANGIENISPKSTYERVVEQMMIRWWKRIRCYLSYPGTNYRMVLAIGPISGSAHRQKADWLEWKNFRYYEKIDGKWIYNINHAH